MQLKHFRTSEDRPLGWLMPIFTDGTSEYFQIGERFGERTLIAEFRHPVPVTCGVLLSLPDGLLCHRQRGEEVLYAYRIEDQILCGTRLALEEQLADRIAEFDQQPLALMSLGLFLRRRDLIERSMQELGIDRALMRTPAEHEDLPDWHEYGGEA